MSGFPKEHERRSDHFPENSSNRSNIRGICSNTSYENVNNRIPPSSSYMASGSGSYHQQQHGHSHNHHNQHHHNPYGYPSNSLNSRNEQSSNYSQWRRDSNHFTQSGSPYHRHQHESDSDSNSSFYRSNSEEISRHTSNFQGRGFYNRSSRGGRRGGGYFNPTSYDEYYQNQSAHSNYHQQHSSKYSPARGRSHYPHFARQEQFSSRNHNRMSRSRSPDKYSPPKFFKTSRRGSFDASPSFSRNFEEEDKEAAAIENNMYNSEKHCEFNDKQSSMPVKEESLDISDDKNVHNEDSIPRPQQIETIDVIATEKANTFLEIKIVDEKIAAVKQRISDLKLKLELSDRIKHEKLYVDKIHFSSNYPSEFDEPWIVFSKSIENVSKAITRRNRELSFERIKDTPKLTPVSFELNLSPMLQERDIEFDKIRPLIFKLMAKKVASIKNEESKLIKNYKKLSKSWKKIMTAFEENRLFPLPAMSYNNAPAAQPEQSSLGYRPVLSARSRRNTNSVSVGLTGRFGDAVRSDEEMNAVLQSLLLSEREDPTVRWRSTLAVVPPMECLRIPSGLASPVFASYPPEIAFQNRNGLLLDPENLLQTSRETALGKWSKTDQSLFLEKFSLYPKQFGRISKFFHGKTSSDCVLFYYWIKKTVSLKKIVSGIGSGRKKKSLSSDENSATGGRKSTQPPSAESPLPTRIKTPSGSSLVSAPLSAPVISRPSPRYSSQSKPTVSPSVSSKWNPVLRSKIVNAFRKYGKNFDAVLSSVNNSGKNLTLDDLSSFWESYSVRYNLIEIVQTATEQKNGTKSSVPAPFAHQITDTASNNPMEHDSNENDSESKTEYNESLELAVFAEICSSTKLIPSTNSAVNLELDEETSENAKTVSSATDVLNESEEKNEKPLTIAELHPF